VCLKRFPPPRNPQQLITRSKLFQDMLQSIQGLIPGNNGNHGQPNDLKIYKEGMFLNVEQA